MDTLILGLESPYCSTNQIEGIQAWMERNHFLLRRDSDLGHLPATGLSENFPQCEL